MADIRDCVPPRYFRDKLVSRFDCRLLALENIELVPRDDNATQTYSLIARLRCARPGIPFPTSRRHQTFALTSISWILSAVQCASPR